MYGKLLTHLREQRSRGQTSLFDEFTGGATDDILGGDSISRDGSDNEDDNGGRRSSPITAKDLTKYAYGVAKGMEYLVSKSVSKINVILVKKFHLIYILTYEMILNTNLPSSFSDYSSRSCC